MIISLVTIIVLLVKRAGWVPGPKQDPKPTKESPE